jgi:hypothetical protein
MQESKPIKPQLGSTLNSILDAFKDASNEFAGRKIVEASIVASPLCFRWQNRGLGVVIGEIGIRDATSAEYEELEESIELGQVQIYKTPLYFTGRVMEKEILHEATGTPLDPNSSAARLQRERWANVESLRDSYARQAPR